MKRGGGCLPRETRIRLYNKVFDLRRRGLSYGQIINWVRKKYGVRLYLSTVSWWLHGVHSPYNGRYIPLTELLTPSEELSYVIGVRLGDGYAFKRRRVVKTCDFDDVRIGLMVKDKEFAVKFARCLAKVLGRHPIKLKYRKGLYVVAVGSKTLYELLKKPVDLERLRKYIEHCGKCTAAFIRGFTDSEGYVSEEGQINICNTEVRLLTYVKYLLQRLGIESTGPRLKRRKGTVFYSPRTGTRYRANKDYYIMRIRTVSNITFYRKVGFTIQRKQKRLEEYLRRRQSQTPSPPSIHFKLKLAV